MKITKKHATKVISLLNHGLVKGLGKPIPGEMCIEAAITVALDLPFNDTPSCVLKPLIRAKINLNDCKWSSNKARAEGMKKLALAQLGSDALNADDFNVRFKLASTKRILPFLIQKHYDDKKDEKLLVYKAKFEALTALDNALWSDFYNYYYNYSNYYNYYYYYYNYYYNYYYYYYNSYNSYYNFGDTFLLLVADVILSVLVDMKAPGLKWLKLLDAFPASKATKKISKSKKIT